MPSLLKKLSNRRRRRSTSSKKDLVGKTAARVVNSNSHSTSNTGSDFPHSISIQKSFSDSSLAVVSPIKPAHRSSSITERTLSSSQSSSAFWNDNDSASGTTASPGGSNSTVASIDNKIIPPRPEQSHWDEEQFMKVIKVWDLSQEEIYMMRELEAKLYDVTHWKNNPFEVVRFMKGPQGYKPAEKLFRKMIKWRIANNVDTILEDYTPPPVLMDYCPSAILEGLDHDGDPIYLERAGATDVAGLLKHFGHKNLIKHTVWLRELCGRGAWIKAHEERMGRPITQVTIVYDLEGLNARHLRPGVLPLFAHMMRLTQDNYTGPVKRMVIIRAPSIFRVVWAIAKNFFDPWAVAKMTFTGPDDCEEKLARFMDLEVLPPCVSPNYGKGKAAAGMPQRFEGGIPPSMDYTEQISQKLAFETMPTKTHELPEGYVAPRRESLIKMMDESDNISIRGNISASNLGSGFFELDEFGDVSASGFFNEKDLGEDDNVVDPLA